MKSENRFVNRNAWDVHWHVHFFLVSCQRSGFHRFCGSLCNKFFIIRSVLTNLFGVWLLLQFGASGLHVERIGSFSLETLFRNWDFYLIYYSHWSHNLIALYFIKRHLFVVRINIECSPSRCLVYWSFCGFVFMKNLLRIFAFSDNFMLSVGLG